MRSAPVAVMLALVAADVATAEVAPTDLRNLARSAEVIVVGTVTVIVEDGLDRYARLHVERIVKGPMTVGESVPFAASPSWTCDMSTAREGERLLLFLDELQQKDATHKDGIVVPRQLRGEKVFAISYSGRGRMHVDDRDGVFLAAISPDVHLPARLDAARAADYWIDVGLDSLIEEIDLCVGDDDGARAKCNASEMTPARRTDVELTTVERPVLTRRWLIGPSTSTAGDIVATCRAYDDVAVVETRDPGIMGAVDITIRSRRGMSAENACAPSFNKKARKLNLSAPSYVDGVYLRWLLLRGADGFGAHLDFALVDMRTGKDVVRATRFTGDGVHFMPRRETAFFYVRALDLDCDPRADGCFARTRERAGIPTDVKLELNVDHCKASPNDVLQLGVGVRIDDLDKPAPHFTGGRVMCAIAP